MHLEAGIDVEIDATEVRAEARLDAFGQEFVGRGRAPRHPGHLDEAEGSPVPAGLAVARALRALEAELMELVHEHIDRSVGD